jgi:hypothetical protein
METVTLISILISCAALIVSAITAWRTLFQRGEVKMTQPTTIFFGPDGSRGPKKIFLRTLLFCTAQRGIVVESMYLKVRRGKSSQTFNIWVYGDKHLSRGSGLFVGKEGVVCNHHFLLPKDGTTYTFLPGQYFIDVFVKLVDTNQPHRISTQSVILSEEFAEKMQLVDAGIFFDWGPDSGKYHSHIDRNGAAELTYMIQNQMKLKERDAHRMLPANDTE